MNQQDSEDSSNSDGVLSDVHVNPIKPAQIGENTFVSRFEVEQDSEGDMVVPRKPRQKEETITIVHEMDSPLEFVGLQMWRGALLLADFLLHNAHLWEDQVFLELGSGPGFSGIVASRVASCCIMTDLDNKVLLNCQRNVDLNTSYFKNGPQVAKVRKLDWEWPLSHFPDSLQGYPSEFGWTSEDLELLRGPFILMAADIVYSDTLSEHIARLVTQILQGNPKNLFYMAIEKRINFSLETLSDRSSIYDFFFNLIRVEGTKNNGSKLVGRRVAVEEIPQRFKYERVPELEIWEIRFCVD